MLRMPRPESMPAPRMLVFESSPLPVTVPPTAMDYTDVTITDPSSITHFGSVLECVKSGVGASMQWNKAFSPASVAAGLIYSEVLLVKVPSNSTIIVGYCTEARFGSAIVHGVGEGVITLDTKSSEVSDGV